MVLAKSRNDSIVQNMITSKESNWMTELDTLQCLGDEITLLLTMYMIYYGEEPYADAQLVG